MGKMQQDSRTGNSRLTLFQPAPAPDWRPIDRATWHRVCRAFAAARHRCLLEKLVRNGVTLADLTPTGPGGAR